MVGYKIIVVFRHNMVPMQEPTKLFAKLRIQSDSFDSFLLEPLDTLNSRINTVPRLTEMDKTVTILRVFLLADVDSFDADVDKQAEGVENGGDEVFGDGILCLMQQI